MMSTMAVLSFTPTYLTLGRNYNPVTASCLVSVAAIAGAFSTAIGGTLSDLLKTRKWIYFGALIWMCRCPGIYTSLRHLPGDHFIWFNWC